MWEGGWLLAGKSKKWKGASVGTCVKVFQSQPETEAGGRTSARGKDKKGKLSELCPSAGRFLLLNAREMLRNCCDRGLL